MAARRMFSKRLIESARFLRLPPDAQVLYFHLGMQADDDGVVEAFNVLRLVGCSEDALDLLQDKGFVKVLNEDLVTYIYDWTENNNVRKDRKVDSLYQDLVRQQIPDVKFSEGKNSLDEEKEPENLENTDGNQVTTNAQPSDNQVTTKCQPSDNQMTAQVRVVEVSVGKDSLDQFSVVEGSAPEDPEPPQPQNENVIQESNNVAEAGNNVTQFVDYQMIVDMYHEKCPSLPKIKGLTARRKQCIKALLEKYTPEQIHDVFQMAQASALLRGEINGKGYERFIAGFDWIINPDNFVKILEGKYDPRGQPGDPEGFYASMETDLLDNY